MENGDSTVPLHLRIFESGQQNAFGMHISHANLNLHWEVGVCTRVVSGREESKLIWTLRFYPISLQPNQIRLDLIE